MLLLTRAADTEADRLSLNLAARGIPQVRIDSDRCRGAALRWDPSYGVLTWQGRTFRPTVCWFRHFTADSLPQRHDMRIEGYLRDQWSALADQLREASGVRVVNAAPSPVGPGRLTQLVAAAEAGLRTPATVVTSRPADASTAVPHAGQFIVKTLGAHFVEAVPGRLTSVFPRRMDRDQLAGASPEDAPVMVQEYVEAGAELRIYRVDGRFHAFEIIKADAEQLWTEPDKVAVRVVEVPAELESPLARLAHRWKLDVAAFDLLRTSNGHVFLEVNTLCDWRWFEQAAGTTVVSDAVAAMLSTYVQETR